MPVAVDPFFWQVARWLLAGVFAVALWHKLRARSEFVTVVGDYRLMPAGIVPFAARSIMLLEGLVLVGLTSGVGVRPAAVLALSLLGLYWFAIAVNLARGRRDIDCGCLGPSGRDSVRHRLSGWLLLRNGVLVGIAGLMLAPLSGRDLLWLDSVTIVPGVIVSVLLYFTTDRLIANRPILEDMLR
ncbi:MAG: MauE/DoxX family redox-associated membrane protein [Woeseia sp.]